jgi:hypothetical protein
MNAAELQQTEGSWKNIMRKKQLKMDQLDNVSSVSPS